MKASLVSESKESISNGDDPRVAGTDLKRVASVSVQLTPVARAGTKRAREESEEAVNLTPAKKQRSSIVRPTSQTSLPSALTRIGNFRAAVGRENARKVARAVVNCCGWAGFCGCSSDFVTRRVSWCSLHR